MKDSACNRWLWLIGLAAVALLFVSFGPFSSGQPKENASGVSVAHWYNTHVDQQWLTIWLVGVALFLLLVFVTQLRAVLVEAGGQRLWPNMVFASGILFIAGIVVSGSFEMTVILASHNHDYAVAHFVNFYNQNNELLLLAGIDFLTFSAGLAMLLNRGAAPLPKRLGWYSIVVALVGIRRTAQHARLPLRLSRLDHRHRHRDRSEVEPGHARTGARRWGCSGRLQPARDRDGAGLTESAVIGRRSTGPRPSVVGVQGRARPVSA